MGYTLGTYKSIGKQTVIYETFFHVCAVKNKNKNFNMRSEGQSNATESVSNKMRANLD